MSDVIGKPPPTSISVKDLEILVRDEGKNPDAYFEVFSQHDKVDATNATVRWHRIVHDATLNQPSLDKLVDKLMNLLIDFACTREEAAEALSISNGQQCFSGQKFASLQEKARRLFVDSPTTGEVGEVLLYFLAEHDLKYPQVLCKFPLKTNPNVHAHGADGVHASIDPATGHLRLHWGEAKLYQDLGGALDECFKSLSELLLEPLDGKKTKRRDLELLKDNVALNNPSLELAIRDYLDPDNVMSNKVKFCGLAFVGFDLKDYVALTDEIARKATEQVGKRIQDWRTKVRGAIEKHELLGITLDVYCIPFVSVQELRDKFLKRLGLA